MWNSKTRLPLLRNRLFGDFPDSRIYAEDSYFISRVLNSNLSYCAFHKHANSKVQKPRSQLRFSHPSIIIAITSNEPWNRETHKTDQNPPITNHKPWPFEPVKVKFCFLRGLLRSLTAAKNAIVSWLLDFRIRMFVKSAVIMWFSLWMPEEFLHFSACYVSLQSDHKRGKSAGKRSSPKLF